MTLNECKLLTNTFWNEECKPFTFDLTKDKDTACYRLGLYSLFVPPDSFPF